MNVREKISQEAWNIQVFAERQALLALPGVQDDLISYWSSLAGAAQRLGNDCCEPRHHSVRELRIRLAALKTASNGS